MRVTLPMDRPQVTCGLVKRESTPEGEELWQWTKEGDPVAERVVGDLAL